MKFKSINFIDLILLKKDFYSRLTDKSMWLYIGIILVGIRDVAFALLGMNSSNTDYAKSFQLSLKTVAILIISVLVIGLVDTISFSYPMFDVIKHFKKRNESNSMALGMLYSSLLTKVMKVYIIVNIVVTPIDILSYLTTNWAVAFDSVILMYISAVLGILGYFWFNGAITRGLCVLFKLPNGVRGLVFVLVFFWNALLGSSIGYLLNQILMRL